MKLYTKLQVEEIYLQGWYDGKIGFKDRIDDAISYQTPIELPSDDESGVIALKIADTLKDKLNAEQEAYFIAGFQTYLKWMKEQILNQNK